MSQQFAIARKKALLFAVAIALLAGTAWIVYGRAVEAPFIYDDSAGVTGNESIRSLWPLVGDAAQHGPLNPRKDITTSGRPLVNFSLAVNYHFGQLNPAGYHLFNLIVHVLSAILLMVIVQRTLCLDYFAGRFDRVSGPLAFAVALLWMVHPLQTETVVYVTQRTELMVGFFYLATLYLSLRYWTASTSAVRATWAALAAMSCLAGMACKEVMVTAPVVVLLYERTLVAGSLRRALRRSWPLYLGLALGWVLLFLLNRTGPRSTTAGFDLGVPAFTWWLSQSKALWTYLKLCFWPWPLLIHYQADYLNTLGEAWPWIVSTALLVIFTIVLLWRRHAVGLVSAWVLIILSPTLVVPIVTEFVAERRMYLPLAALATLVVVGGFWLAQHVELLLRSVETQRKPGRAWPEVLAAAGGISLAVILGLVSVHRLGAYRDELTLWQDDVIHQPNDPIAHYNLGEELDREGRTAEAVEQYLNALRLKPDYPDAYNNLGRTYASAGRWPEAIEQYQQALRYMPSHADAHNNLGNALSNTGRMLEAVEHFQQALRLKPGYAAAHYNFGIALARLGRTQEAIEQYQEAIKLNPGLTQAHFNLALVLAQVDRSSEAIVAAQAAPGAGKIARANRACSTNRKLARFAWRRRIDSSRRGERIATVGPAVNTGKMLQSAIPRRLSNAIGVTVVRAFHGIAIDTPRRLLGIRLGRPKTDGLHCRGTGIVRHQPRLHSPAANAPADGCAPLVF